MCMEYSTVTPGCGACPQTVPTATIAIGCDQECPGGCGGTEIIFATEANDCEAAAPTDGGGEPGQGGTGLGLRQGSGAAMGVLLAMLGVLLVV
jgi:hypothetical protein